MLNRLYKLGVGLLLAAAVFTPHARARAQASAALEPDSVAPGEPAVLRVTTSEQGAPPHVPQRQGLSIRAMGEQSSMTSRNGVVQRSVTYLYEVRADAPGDYPLDDIQVDGASVPGPSLHVSSAPPRTSPPSAAHDSAEPQLAALRFRLDKPRMYAGQSVPFSVQACFRGGTGVTLKGRPELSSDAFTVRGLDDEPTQTQIERDGVPYLAVTWRGTLSAVKPGDYALGVSMPVVLQYRQAHAVDEPSHGNRLRDMLGGSPLFDGLLNDPFFDSFLDQPLLGGLLQPGRVIERELTLRAQAGRTHVLPLPERDRPQDFSGAIGQFELEANLGRTDLTQGEPVDLQYTLRGRGNFGQFRGPALQDSSDFRSYDATSNERAAGLTGSVHYQQPIAALRAGELRVPGLTFSYFDPDAARYVTRTTPAIPVHVAAAAVSTSARPDHAEERDDAASRGLASLERGGVPAWLWPAALGVLGSAGLLALGIWLARSPQRARWSRDRRRRQLLRERRRALQRAVHAGDAASCVRAARGALQQQLSAAWGMRAESVSLRELDARWPAAPSQLRRVFELADAFDYAGERTGRLHELEDLPTWARRVDGQLAHLEVPR